MKSTGVNFSFLTTVGIRNTPSVLGGNRPNVRDDAAMTVRKVSYLRAEVEKRKAALESVAKELAIEEEFLSAMRKQCKKCGRCSACTG